MFSFSKKLMASAYSRAANIDFDVEGDVEGVEGLDARQRSRRQPSGLTQPR